MGIAILKLHRYLKLLNGDVSWSQQFDQKSVEPVQKHVNKCEQRIIPEHNAFNLLKLCHEWHNHISLSQKEPYKRKMIQNGSDINAREKL